MHISITWLRDITSASDIHVDCFIKMFCQCHYCLYCLALYFFKLPISKYQLSTTDLLKILPITCYPKLAGKNTGYRLPDEIFDTVPSSVDLSS